MTCWNPLRTKKGNHMRQSKQLYAIIAFLFVLAHVPAWAETLPFIDAHSQMAGQLDESVIIPLMDKAGVAVTILSARNDRDPIDVLQFAKAHPDRIIAAVRTKGRPFNLNSPKYNKFLDKQLQNQNFKAMAEVLLYHAQKGKKAPEIVVYPDDPASVYSLAACLERGWPFIVHIEFASAGGKRSVFMKKLEAMLNAHPDHPFVLIHMAQLDADEAGRLLAAHSNLHFLTSHSNPVSRGENRQPWSNLFKGKSIAPAWRTLMERYPDRFILAFDNVWADNWGDFYLRQATLWREALSELPSDLAHAIAHRNAERLWKIAPVQ